MSTNNSERIQRISLLSSSFSGSTLLGIILCQDSRFVSFGDTYLIPGISDEQSLCNCGETIAECKFRTKLVQQLIKLGLPESMIVSRDYATPFKFISSRFGGERAIGAYKLAGGLIGYQNIFREFYRKEALFLSAIETVGDCEFYIDGNKNLVRSHLFAEEDEQTLIIHLIRHPFAVLHSSATRHIERGRAIQSHLKSWMFYNRSAKKLCEKYPSRSVTIYFDDLVSNPTAVLEEISSTFNFGKLDIDADNLDPTKTHLIGNRSRHNATRVRSKQKSPTAEDLRELGVTSEQIKLLLDAADSFGLTTHS